MNDWRNDTDIDDAQLDLLVDGELPEGQRRRLLASLDDEPGGWRRCALAFLEAQSWGQALSGIASRPPQSASTGTVGRGWPRLWASPALSLVAVAASFLLAFVLGVYVRGWSGGGQGAPAGFQIAADGAREQRPRPEEGLESCALAIEQRAPTRSPEQSLADSMTLVVDDGGSSQKYRVPLVDAKSLEPYTPWEDAAAVPSEMLRNLESMGHRVQRQRRYAPVELDDGWQMMLPVEDVEIVPVARQFH